MVIPTITTTGSDTNINPLSPGSGTIDVQISKIVNVTDPIGEPKTATKAYVDTQVFQV